MLENKQVLSEQNIINVDDLESPERIGKGNAMVIDDTQEKETVKPELESEPKPEPELAQPSVVIPTKEKPAVPSKPAKRRITPMAID